MKTFWAFFLTFTLPLSACYWDRDTIRAELSGHLETVKTLVGWFDRYPPLYYQKRLERVTAALAKSPRKASLYDDAAVASDRLGRSDEAIAWMEKKQEYADTEKVATGTPTTRYKTLANLGTFHAHRWIRQKKNQPDAPRNDLDQAISFIEQAIAEYPAAHFNREKYQLQVLQWLGGEENQWVHIIDHSFPGHSQFSDKELTEMETGLLGLVQLGAAWESPDLFFLLQGVYLAQEQAHPNLLANLRVAELLHDGKSFLHPELEPIFTDPAEIDPGKIFLAPELFNETLAYYEEARQSTEAREKAFTAYLTTRLKKGQHPDTDADFWNNWQEHKLPRLPWTASLANAPFFLFGTLGLLLVIVLVLILVKAIHAFRGRGRSKPERKPTI